METRVRRAVVSVHDKQGIVELCRTLSGLGIEILSSGGTARLLEQHGIAVIRVSDYTGHPEMLDGRVKTLHPRLHAGILAVRDNDSHMGDLARAQIGTIDLVVVNLYPFETTAAIEGIAMSDAVEMIDVGGPSLIRAAAKNFAHVGVVVSHEDYERVARVLQEHGQLPPQLRQELAVKAFRHTASYDSAIFAYLARSASAGAGAVAEALPERLQLDFLKAQDLRYGENPHQRAAFYSEPVSSGPALVRARELNG
jgi:phosphoribosylaminoimidazolecarboxamide formyltransferase/IMP cyclohydrolase